MTSHNNRQPNRRTQRQQARKHRANPPRQNHSPRLLPLGPKQVEEKRTTKNSSDVDSNEDVIRRYTDEVVVVNRDIMIELGDELLLIDVVGESGGSQRLAHDAEDHGELVDDEFCAAAVVFVVPHVAGFEFVPLHFFEVEAPYYSHFGGCVYLFWRVGREVVIIFVGGKKSGWKI